MKKAIALLRVSSEGQTKRAGADDGYSIEVQREGCVRKAAELDATIGREFVGPAQSASKGVYPALRDALAFIREQKDIDYLIVYRLDRLARDELTNFAAYAELRAAGCELVSVMESIDGSTPQGMLALGILASVNAYRSRDDARKITEGRIKKAQLGGTPYRVPPGYVNVRSWDGSNDIRTVELDEERAPHIRYAFEACATGDWPLRALVEELYERGLRSRATPKRPPGKIGVSALHRILRNPYYIGVVEFQGVQYEGKHPKLITPELFERVQQVLTAHSHAGEQQWKHEHYLNGTVYRGLCGRRLIFTKCTGRRGGKYDYFVCGARHEGGSCALPYLSALRVEVDVAEYYLRQIRLDAERVAWLEPRLVEQFRLLTGYREQEASRAHRKVEEIEGQRRQLVADHLANPRAIPLDVLEAQQTELGRKLAAARKQLAAAEADVGRGEEGLRLAKECLHDSARTYRKADPQTRRRWNQVFCRKLWIGPQGAVGDEPTDEFGSLLADELVEKLEEAPPEPSAFRAEGSNSAYLVETVGIEPTSAGACRAASTSVAGALRLASRSPRRRGSGKPAPLDVPAAPGALAAG